MQNYTYHQVTLTLLVGHLLLKGSTEGIQRVTLGCDLLVGEDTDCTTRVRSRVKIIKTGSFGAGYLRHLRPDTSCSFSSALWNVVLDATAATRSFSFDELAARIFWVASFQEIGCFRKSCSSTRRKPMSTRTLTNSGNPAYRRVPRTTVCASGMLYLEKKED